MITSHSDFRMRSMRCDYNDMICRTMKGLEDLYDLSKELSVLTPEERFILTAKSQLSATTVWATQKFYVKSQSRTKERYL